MKMYRAEEIQGLTGMILFVEVFGNVKDLRF